MKYIISGITTLLAVVWIYMGYLGWTWIPVGRIPQKGQTRVACVGDSITYGALIRNWYRWNYPHQLQLILGSKYCVHNYGMSDRTGMETGNHSYGKEGNEYSFGIRLSEIKEECVTLKELAEQYSLPVIDIYTFTEGHPEWFCRDGIHPNAEGNRKIAEYIGNRLLAS